MSRCTRSFGRGWPICCGRGDTTGSGRWFIVAGESYLGLATTSAEVVERVSGLCRAVAICKESNLPTEAGVDSGEAHLDQPDWCR